VKSRPVRELSGVAGRATLLELSERDDPAQSGTVSAWLLVCPGQAAGWTHYIAAVVHLRPIDGAQPAYVRWPAATHEVLLYALDPGRNPSPTDPSSWCPLLPLNVCEQLELPSDAAAVQLLELSVAAVLDGRLWAEPPLSGQAEPWQTTLLQTAAHLRGEPHGLAPSCPG